MGNETLAREDARSVWSFPMVDDLWQDLKYGVRVLSRNAGSTVVTVLVLAIGIGVNTAVFTAYKAVVAQPLDARNPDEMVNIALTRDSGRARVTFSYPDYEMYRDSIRSLSGLVAVRSDGMTLSNAGRTISRGSQMAESLLGSWTGIRGGSSDEFAGVFVVSENYFEVLGVAAIQGRTFESISTSELLAFPSVLISENYWQRRFEGDPAILGKTIHLNRVPVTIIGITPRDFRGTGRNVPAFWLPAGIEPLVNTDTQWLHNRENQRYRLFGRLAPGASIAQTQAEMSRVADHVRTLHDPLSESSEPTTALIWPGSPEARPLEMEEELRWIILLITCATGIVLAVACANVASLQLARARSRENELRTRLSLGASRLRVIRQLLTESVLVGLLAGTIAFPFSWVLLKELAALLAQAITFNGHTTVFDVTPDLEVFTCVLAISLLAGLLSGFAPAMESSRTALAAIVRAGTSSARSRRLQSLLVTAQVSLSLVLLIAAGMLIRSSLNVINTSTGYDARQVIFLGVGFTRASEYTDARKLV
jgi:predicted permease